MRNLTPKILIKFYEINVKLIFIQQTYIKYLLKMLWIFRKSLSKLHIPIGDVFIQRLNFHLVLLRYSFGVFMQYALHYSFQKESYFGQKQNFQELCLIILNNIFFHIYKYLYTCKYKLTLVFLLTNLKLKIKESK